MRVSWLLILLALGCTQLANAADLTPQSPDRVPLWQSLETLPDAAAQHTPATAAQALDAGQGRQLPSANHAYGKWIPYPYWGHFSLRNTSSTA